MILDDLFKGVLGQQDTPQFNLQNTDQLLGSVAGSLPQLQGINRSFNLGNTTLARDMENIYDPNQGKLREATTASILAQLGLGGAIPQEVQDQVIQQALQGNAASGFGASNAGRGVVARDLGTTGMDILNQRIGRAASYTRSAPIMSPSGVLTPGDVADQILGNQNAQNSFNTFASGIKSQNRVNMIKQPLDLAAGAAGAFFGFNGPGTAFSSVIKPAMSGAGGGGGGFGNTPSNAGVLSNLGLAY